MPINFVRAMRTFFPVSTCGEAIKFDLCACEGIRRECYSALYALFLINGGVYYIIFLVVSFAARSASVCLTVFVCVCVSITAAATTAAGTLEFSAIMQATQIRESEQRRLYSFASLSCDYE